MLIEDLFGTKSTDESQTFHVLQSSCSQFITESAGYPLFRNLPSTYAPVQRVKVRAKKKPGVVGEAFNRAFENNYQNLAQRAIFARPAPSSEEGTEPYYVFPINGYKFIYSREVVESTSGYQQVMNTLVEQLKDEQTANDIVADLLKFTYTSSNLIEGINSGSEIIIYGIPYFYAVRCSSYPEYARIISS